MGISSCFGSQGTPSSVGLIFTRHPPHDRGPHCISQIETSCPNTKVVPAHEFLALHSIFSMSSVLPLYCWFCTVMVAILPAFSEENTNPSMVVTSSPNKSNCRVNCEFSQAPVLPQCSWKLCVGFTNVLTDPLHECGSGHLSCSKPSKHLSIPVALCPDGPRSQFPSSISPTKLNFVPRHASDPKHFKSSMIIWSHPLLITLISALRHDSCPLQSKALMRNVSFGASGLHAYPAGGPGITTSKVIESHDAVPVQSNLNPGKTGSNTRMVLPIQDISPMHSKSFTICVFITVCRQLSVDWHLMLAPPSSASRPFTTISFTPYAPEGPTESVLQSWHNKLEQVQQS